MENFPITVGRIVDYYPGTASENQLPNGMEKAPAIVVQAFGTETVNLHVMVAQTDSTKPNSFTAWSVPKQSEEKGFGWSWPQKIPVGAIDWKEATTELLDKAVDEAFEPVTKLGDETPNGTYLGLRLGEDQELKQEEKPLPNNSMDWQTNR
ncbi:MAG: hypothetical protein K9H61_02415 [Bacteroidia bacterium]|nr:hypothetical protein [Bacteroidia bacterium]MCF8427180.1 hypothetical protein [Bacteroidia bacterium]MCF8445825.1 hypothetical protein [Bacteroidia bacterium]